MSTLLFERSLPRFAAARVASAFGSGRGAGVGPLRLVDQRRTRRCRPTGWVHVDPVLSGICGSDLATLDGRSSRYFEDIVSFPFVPGPRGGRHARPTTPSAPMARRPGRRAAGSSSSRCSAARPGASSPPCPACQAGPRRATAATSPSGTSARACRPASAPTPAAAGRARASSRTPASSSPCPTSSSDADAVTVEPVACAVHAVLGAGIARGRRRRRPRRGHARAHRHRRAGHLAATGRCPAPGAVLVGAKLRPPAAPGPRARRHRGAAARPAGPCRAPPQPLAVLRRRVRRRPPRSRAAPTSCIDCVGSAESIAQSLAMVRPRGTVALVGMPGKVTVDLAPLWHREVRLAGAYAYGTETRRRRHRRAGRADVRARPSRSPRRSRPAASCRPPTRSPASRTPWPTPAPPDAGAPSRSHSTYGKDTTR